MYKYLKKLSANLSVKILLDKEIIEYSLTAILSSLLCFIGAIIACLLLGNVYYALVFILLLTPLKMQFESIHCSTMERCILTYTLSVAFSLLIYKTIIYYNYTPSLFIAFILYLFLLINIRNDFNINKNKKYIYIIIYFSLILYCYFFYYSIYIILLLVIVYESVIVLLKNAKYSK